MPAQGATVPTRPEWGSEAVCMAIADRGTPGNAASQTDDTDSAIARVQVPLNERRLAWISPERRRRLQRNLVEAMRGMRVMKDPRRNASPVRAEPEGIAGRVARAACTICKGWCCKSGGEHAFLDERVVARVRNAAPELDARAVLGRFMACVPEEGYYNSCIFHGLQGCTLERTLRSDVCNSFFCTALGNFVKDPTTAGSVRVTAGQGDDARSVLVEMEDQGERR